MLCKNKILCHGLKFAYTHLHVFAERHSLYDASDLLAMSPSNKEASESPSESEDFQDSNNGNIE